MCRLLCDKSHTGKPVTLKLSVHINSRRLLRVLAPYWQKIQVQQKLVPYDETSDPKRMTTRSIQCCGSGMFYPGGKKAPDPGSDLFLYKGYYQILLIAFIKKNRSDPGSCIKASRIRGVKKHRIPDPDPQHWINC
jgi:hypothetical protein